MCDCGCSDPVLVAMSGMYETADGEFIYSGGPLVVTSSMSDDSAQSESRIRTTHQMDGGTNVCRKCKKTQSYITDNPYEECLYDVDFSTITMGVVGGR